MGITPTFFDSGRLPRSSLKATIAPVYPESAMTYMQRSQLVYLEHDSAILADNPLGDPHARSLPVYLPPDYETNTTRRYPVIWMLAPFTGWGERLLNLQAWDENVVQRLDRLIRSGVAEQAIMVLPDAFTRYGGSQYVNSSATGRYQDYLIEELIPFVDRTLRTLPERERRAVMGHSSGGYGALALAMRCPDVFGAVASHSGDTWFETCYWPDIPGAIRAFEQHDGVGGFLKTVGDTRDRNRDWWNGMSMVAMSACYSPDPEQPHGFVLPFDTYTGEIDPAIWSRWQALDPIRLAADYIEALKGLGALYFDCGSRDEYNLFLGARRLHRLLRQNQVKHIYEEFDGGHQHINWRYDVSLPIVTRAIAPRKGK